MGEHLDRLGAHLGGREVHVFQSDGYRVVPEVLPDELRALPHLRKHGPRRVARGVELDLAPSLLAESLPGEVLEPAGQKTGAELASVVRGLEHVVGPKHLIFGDAEMLGAPDLRIVDEANGVTILAECQRAYFQTPERLRRNLGALFVEETDLTSASVDATFTEVLTVVTETVGRAVTPPRSTSSASSATGSASSDSDGPHQGDSRAQPIARWGERPNSERSG